MGTIARPPSDEAECWCFKYLSLSREVSRSVDGMVVEIESTGMLCGMLMSGESKAP
jgi:hypothetical protein